MLVPVSTQQSEVEQLLNERRGLFSIQLTTDKATALWQARAAHPPHTLHIPHCTPHIALAQPHCTPRTALAALHSHSHTALARPHALGTPPRAGGS